MARDPRDSRSGDDWEGWEDGPPRAHAAPYFPYQFTVRLALHHVGTLPYRVVFLPADVRAAFPEDAGPRPRLEGEIADRPFSAGWQPAGDGRLYAMVPPPLVTEAGLAIGDEVELRFRLVPSDRVDLPDELAAALAADRTAAELFGRLTPGRQRGVAHMVASAKSDATRRRRAADLLAKLKAGEPIGAPPARRRREAGRVDTGTGEDGETGR